MCGIVGYIGDRVVKDVLYQGLQKLEYRGYDSAGVAILDNGKLKLEKATGKLINLGEKLKNVEFDGHIGIAHTRWATHGKPSDLNAHPHQNCSKTMALVHNGIIENYKDLKQELIEKDHKGIVSETDSEIIAHMISEYYTGNLLGTVEKTIEYLEGAYAFAVTHEREPDKIVVARKGSPLIIGIGENENFIASDIPAVLEYTKKVIYLDDYEIANITKNSVEVYDMDGNRKEKKIHIIDWNLEMAEKGGYKHFMLKEIYEQPRVIRDTLRGKIKDNSVHFDHINLTDEEINEISKITVVACGTALYAGMVGRYLIEDKLRIPVEYDVASEFRYKNPILGKNDLILLVSQSGETADTLESLRIAKNSGAKVVGIVNVVGSTMTREAKGTIYTNAGPEIGVASTKAFISQLVSIYLLTIFLGEKKKILCENTRKQMIDTLFELPEMVDEVLIFDKEILRVAEKFLDADSFIYMGRNVNYPIAMEGALKLKEISYIHAEGYPAGELKHGPIALIEEKLPTVAIAVQGKTYEKLISNIQEVRARGGKVIAIASNSDKKIAEYADEVLRVHDVDEFFSPILTVLPMQLLAYHISDKRGLDVDKPRNLAKSVTVE